MFTVTDLMKRWQTEGKPDEVHITQQEADQLLQDNTFHEFTRSGESNILQGTDIIVD